MDLNVPTAFTQVTRCFATNILEDGKNLVGICTTSGQFLEFVDKKLVDSYELDEDADELNIFTSYNPLQKYYLIRCQKKLIVMKRNKPLCVVKTYNGVTRIEVRDRLGIGRPQAVIWVESEQQPIVTDFVNELIPLGPQPVPALTSGLSTKLQEMNLRLDKARKVLQDKKKTRLNALYQLCPHNQTSVKVDDGSEVLAWGPGPPPPPAAPLLPPLQVSRPWRKVHNSKWIIGIPLSNQSDTLAGNLTFCKQVGPLVQCPERFRQLIFFHNNFQKF